MKLACLAFWRQSTCDPKSFSAFMGSGLKLLWSQSPKERSPQTQVEWWFLYSSVKHNSHRTSLYTTETNRFASKDGSHGSQQRLSNTPTAKGQKRLLKTVASSDWGKKAHYCGEEWKRPSVLNWKKSFLYKKTLRWVKHFKWKGPAFREPLKIQQ